jgi:hypothetical protein
VSRIKNLTRIKGIGTDEEQRFSFLIRRICVLSVASLSRRTPLLSGDGDCEDRREQDHAQEECKEECKEKYQAGEADQPVLARVYAGAWQGSGRKGKLQAEGEADRRREEGGFAGCGCFEAEVSFVRV